MKAQTVSSKTKLLLVCAFVVAMTLNGLAGSTTLLGGVNTADVSNNYQNLFTPAGSTFAIWGVIYLLMLSFVLYVLGVGRNQTSSAKNATLTHIATLATINLVINSTWIIAWQYQILWLSVLLIIALLINLALIVERLKRVDVKVSEYVQLKLPFSIYFGWVTVATVANIATWLVSIQWNGFGIIEQIWMIIITAVAALIGLYVGLRNQDIAYLAVFIWAFTGILNRHISNNGYNGAYPEVIVTIIIVLTIIAACILMLGKKIILSRPN